MARPSRKTEILEYLAQGWSVADAARSLGMRADSIYKMRWDKEWWAQWQAIKASPAYLENYTRNHPPPPILPRPPKPEPPPKPRTAQQDWSAAIHLDRLVTTARTMALSRFEASSEIGCSTGKVRYYRGIVRNSTDPWLQKQIRIPTQPPVFDAVGEFIYFLRDLDRNWIKIGYATNPRLRFREYKVYVRFEVLKIVRGNARQERELHNRFWPLWVFGEWFRPEGPLLEFIHSLTDTVKIPYGYGRFSRPEQRVLFHNYGKNYQAQKNASRHRYQTDEGFREKRRVYARERYQKLVGKLPQAGSASHANPSIPMGETGHQECGD